MKLRAVVGTTGVLALALAAGAVAAPSEYKVTGGGQALATANANGVKGPGDTITFQAFITQVGADEDATGQVNIIDRTDGGGGKGVHYRGTVECTYLVTDGLGGGYAELQGRGRTQDGRTTPFVVRIRDNGQGAAADPDQIEFDRTANPPSCDEDNSDEDPEFFLARGNAKIHKESPSRSGSQQRSGSGSGSSTRSSSPLTSLLR